MTNLCVLLFVTLAYLLETAIADILVIGGPKNDTMYRFAAKPATFGPDIPSEGVEGYLVLANPIQACSNVRPPPDHSNVTMIRPWILLIKRGGCDFDTKVLNAQSAGYIAAVVYNNVSGSQTLIPMSGNSGSDVRIPSVFVSYRDGLFLIQDFLFTSGYYVILTPDYPVITLNAILLPFAIVVGICFFVLTMVLVAKYVRDRRRRRRHRLPRSQLKKIAIKKYKKGDGNDVCAICLDEFEEGDKLRVLPCHHQYHCKCVDPWLLNNKRVCPVCKRKVIPGDSSDEEGTAGQSTREPSESTPLLSPAANMAGPLENDVHVQQPHMLVNVEFCDDEDEYDGDTEDANENPRLIRDEIRIPSTSAIQSSETGASPPTGTSQILTTTSPVEDQDVPLIHLNDSVEALNK